ncbi:hypothetical protein DPMN_118393 [Dreissena polymorpha]|uniref:STAS domain-containing protein n=1 Tax=Dreissena polymorpha TaxID=45954 RepID=A0A9D4GK38_DREPO|nr:hypothetical protein DPMN_118393 [Dreissena polymorpha]
MNADDKESVWLVTFIAVVVFDVALGLLIGIVFSLYFVLRHSQKPEMSEMGQLPETGMYNDLRVTKQVTEVPGMKIFRFETSIYFANAEHFRDRLYKKTGLLPRKLLKRKRKAMHETLQRRKRELEEMELEKKRKAAQSPQRHYHIEVVTEAPVDPYEQQLKRAAENRLIMERFAAAWQPPIKVIIIDLSVVNYIDSVGVKTLSSIVTQYKEVGIKTFIAGSKPDVRTMLRTADFTKTIDYSSLYSTVHEAVVIGQEIVDEEIRKNIPPREDIKLMIEISNRDPNAPENDGNDQFEEEDDEEEDSDGKPAQPSILNLKDAHNDDDDDTWFDVSPYDFEMRTVQVHPETVGLLHREETAEVEGGAASISRRGKIVTFSSRGSLIHDEDFDNVPLSQDHTESSAL